MDTGVFKAAVVVDVVAGALACGIVDDPAESEPASEEGGTMDVGTVADVDEFEPLLLDEQPLAHAVTAAPAPSWMN
ncbi:MAG: hypothetical protein ABIR32_07485 [Ilumatobacteraceae bacterium]